MNSTIGRSTEFVMGVKRDLEPGRQKTETRKSSRTRILNFSHTKLLLYRYLERVDHA